MSEIRLNVVTREWVIIATERAKRPTDFRNNKEKNHLPRYLVTCPFCPGNERRTPSERFRLPDGENWKIRVVANKFPALSPEVPKTRHEDSGLARVVSGTGIHEVIIETPLHNLTTGLLDAPQLEDLLRIYRARFIEAHRDIRIEHAIIFKNHGEGAGTSLEHSHSQLIATPIVPVQFRDRVEAALHYFDDTGECVICAVSRKDREDGTRIILDTEHFVTLIPYAALSPFHTWLFPKRHSASFASISEEETKDLAIHLKTILSKFHYGLDDPDYNYVIKSSRPQDEGNEYCHWYITIIPRLTMAAGFELGSGMFINSSLPEKNAEFLRSVKVE
ncbi:MAG: galactose-1-phosphate uridylyltransferase [Deltaproteobacteria bacterium]|nr:galactose-1-phosphate uridylyltransferase [Deltaproteobacteria bacterium]